MRNTVNARDYLTDREKEEFEQEKELAKMQADYQMDYKKLELELRKIDVKWQQVFRLPLAVLLLPVKLILAFAIPISAISGKELSKEYWEFMKR